MKKTYISINGQVIRKNSVTGSKEPPIRIAKSRHDQNPRYAHAVEIKGPCRLIYNSAAPIMRCGARLVLEIDGEVEITQ